MNKHLKRLPSRPGTSVGGKKLVRARIVDPQSSITTSLVPNQPHESTNSTVSEHEFLMHFSQGFIDTGVVIR